MIWYDPDAHPPPSLHILLAQPEGLVGQVRSLYTSFTSKEHQQLGVRSDSLESPEKPLRSAKVSKVYMSTGNSDHLANERLTASASTLGFFASDPQRPWPLEILDRHGEPHRLVGCDLPGQRSWANYFLEAC